MSITGFQPQMAGFFEELCEMQEQEVLLQKTIQMWPSVRKGEEENIFPIQEEADVMFNSALIYELAVLKPYVETQLFRVEESAYRNISRQRDCLNSWITLLESEAKKCRRTHCFENLSVAAASGFDKWCRNTP